MVCAGHAEQGIYCVVNGGSSGYLHRKQNASSTFILRFLVAKMYLTRRRFTIAAACCTVVVLYVTRPKCAVLLIEDKHNSWLVSDISPVTPLSLIACL